MCVHTVIKCVKRRKDGRGKKRMQGREAARKEGKKMQKENKESVIRYMSHHMRLCPILLPLLTDSSISESGNDLKHLPNCSMYLQYSLTLSTTPSFNLVTGCNTNSHLWIFNMISIQLGLLTTWII